MTKEHPEHDPAECLPLKRSEKKTLSFPLTIPPSNRAPVFLSDHTSSCYTSCLLFCVCTVNSLTFSHLPIPVLLFAHSSLICCSPVNHFWVFSIQNCGLCSFFFMVIFFLSPFIHSFIHPFTHSFIQRMTTMGKPYSKHYNGPCQ